jgi:hypothetical protein
MLYPLKLLDFGTDPQTIGQTPDAVRSQTWIMGINTLSYTFQRCWIKLQIDMC